MGLAAVSMVRVAGRRIAAGRRTGPGPAAGTSRISTRVQPGPPSTPLVNSKRSGATPDSPCRPSRCCAGVSDYRSGFEGVPDRMLRSLRIRDASVELRDLALGQMTPGSTSESARRAPRSTPRTANSPRAPSLGRRRRIARQRGQHDARARGQAHVRHGRQQAAVRHFTEGDIATHAPQARPARSSRRSPPKRASASSRPHPAAAPPPGQRCRPSSRDGRRSTQLPPAAVLDGMAAPHPIARTPYVLTSAERLPPGPSAAPLYPLPREQA
jgi:hypothetical protein